MPANRTGAVLKLKYGSPSFKFKDLEMARKLIDGYLVVKQSIQRAQRKESENPDAGR